MPKTYQGSCHCGQIRFEADIDLANGTSRCNCSYCSKSRWWGITLKPDAFRLVAGEGGSTDYRFNTRQGAHSFCPTCGLCPYSHGDIPELGGKVVSVNVACLDGVPPEALAAAPVQYCDGLHDNWMNAPKITSHL